MYIRVSFLKFNFLIAWKNEDYITQFFWLSALLNVSYAFSTCMTDCTSLLTPHPPSLYEQHCCNSDNNGKTI